MTESTKRAGASDSARPHYYVPALDGVRGLAVLAVIAYHDRELTAGWLGVDVFFVLSGYLITGILVKARSGPNYFRNFWGRRVLRIFPPYIAFCTLVLLLLPAIGVLPEPVEQWSIWTFLTNVRVAVDGWYAVPHSVSHLWSLAVEEQFYLAWPLVVWAVAPAKLRQVCGWGVVVALLLRLGAEQAGASYDFRHVLMPTRMDSLLVGGWLAVTPWTPPRWLTAAAGVAMGTVLGYVTYFLRGTWPTVGYTVFALITGVLLAAVLTEPWLARVFAWKPLRLAGRYSYTAYLLHPLVLELLQPARFPVYTRRHLVLLIVVTFTLSAVSWKVFESPILVLKDRFFPSIHPNPARPDHTSVEQAARA